MLSLDITLAGDASSSTTYSLVSVAGGNSLRADAAAPLGSPRNLQLKTSEEKQGKVGVRRHLIRLDRTQVDAVTGEVAVVSAYVVLVNPTRITTTAQLLDMVTQLKNFLSTANLTKVLNGEP